jgi:hypothetical protein
VRDRSLDEFLDAGEASSDEESPDEASDAGADESDASGPAPVAADPSLEPAIRRVGPDVPPAASTYACSPGGAPCAACGARVERRWRDEERGGLVCGDCKVW